MSTGDIVQTINLVPSGACGGGAEYQHYFRKSWVGDDLSAAERLAGLPYPSHAYTCTVEKVNRGRCIYKPTESLNLVSKCVGGWSNPGQDWTANDELRLLGKLGDKIRGHDFNAGIALGTGHQTAALIGSSAARLANGLRALKSGLGPKAIVNALNGAKGRASGRGRERPTLDEHRDVEMSRRWLEASYGWMPLLSDVHGAAQALALHVQKVQQVTFTARHSSEWRVIDRKDSYHTSHEFVRNRKQIVYTFERESDLPSEFVKLGLTDPLSVAWELVPWSFAIDWFLPIGSMLRSAALFPKLKGKYVKTWTKQSGAVRRVIHPDYAHLEDYTHYKHHVVSRVSGTVLSVPTPSFKSPFSESWKRTANQIALLGALRARKT